MNTKHDPQIAMCELTLNRTIRTANRIAKYERERRAIEEAQAIPKPTPLNHLPLLYALFDMGGITTPAADAYEAHLFAQEEALQNPTEPALDEGVRDAAPL